MKRKLKKRWRNIGKRALLIGAGAFIVITGVKGCRKNEDNSDTVSYIDYGISDDVNINNVNVANTFTIEDAIKEGYLANVSYDELRRTINNNGNIDNNIKNIILGYIDVLYDKFPNFNNAVLNKNMSLLQIVELSEEEMYDRCNNPNTNIIFNPIEHIVYYTKGSDLNDNFSHAISHMINECVFTVDNCYINIQFSDDGFGQGIEEEICNVFRKTVFSDETNCDVSDGYLLNQIIGSDNIINSYLNGNVYNICKSLEEINPYLDSERLISLIDDKIVYGNYDNYDIIQSLISEYFVSKEAINLNFDYINYLSCYVNNCCNFQSLLNDFGASDNTIYKFKELRNDHLAKITRDSYTSIEAKDTVILNSDPNGMNPILNNVDGSELYIYNYDKNQYGINHIGYIALSKDDPTDGFFDLLSGQMVYPDELFNQADIDYYIENQGTDQKRLRIIHK